MQPIPGEFFLRKDFVYFICKVAASRLQNIEFHGYRTGAAIGLVAEWLRRGLQILVSQFDSGRGLHIPLRMIPRTAHKPCFSTPGAAQAEHLF